MEEHKIDSLVKKALNESDNFYDAEAIKAEDRIWNQIQPQKQEKPLYIRFLAAASILLFIGLSAVTYYNMKHRSVINELVESNVLLKKDLMISKQNLLTKKETMTASYKPVTDTIYIEKKIVEYKPQVTTQHVTDTVYIEQIVYIEKEPVSNLMTVNDPVSSFDSTNKKVENNYQSDIIISNNESLKKKKPKKMRIKFGGNRSQNRKGTLALTTKPK